MENIRHSVFETNSSSTHSISISSESNGIYETIEPVDGVITLIGGEFGWAWDQYNSAMVKANYAAIYAMSNGLTEMLTDILKEHTGAKEVVLSFSNDYDSDHYSYIDHQSHDCCGAAFLSKESLKDFIFNPKSWLFTGNDNEEAHPNFYDVDSDKNYCFELKMNDVDDSIKFSEKPSAEKLHEAISYLGNKHPKCNLDYSERYTVCDPNSWDLHDIHGVKINSFERYANGITEITLFRLESTYAPNTTGVSGKKIKASITVKFSLNEI